MHLHLSLLHCCLLVQILSSNLHSHLHVSCHSMCLVLLVLEIRSNTLMFKFFTTSGTQIFAYGWLILLQLLLHLLVLILNGNTCSSPLTLRTCGLVLNAWLFIEIRINEFTLVKLDKIVNPTKKHFFNKSKRFYLHYVIFFSLNICECPLYHQHQ